jgi:hypothetical protein
VEYKGNHERKLNPELAKEMRFDDWVDLLFEDWFTDYCKQNSANCADMRGPLYAAFKKGWLMCENFYS